MSTNIEKESAEEIVKDRQEIIGWIGCRLKLGVGVVAQITTTINDVKEYQEIVLDEEKDLLRHGEGCIRPLLDKLIVDEFGGDAPPPLVDVSGHFAGDPENTNVFMTLGPSHPSLLCTCIRVADNWADLAWSRGEVWIRVKDLKEGEAALNLRRGPCANERMDDLLGFFGSEVFEFKEEPDRVVFRIGDEFGEPGWEVTWEVVPREGPQASDEEVA